MYNCTLIWEIQVQKDIELFDNDAEEMLATLRHIR